MKTQKKGFVLITILIIFCILTLLISAIVRTVTLFSSYSFKKEEYMRQWYATDALMHYGIAHVLYNYDTITYTLSFTQAPVIVPIPAWLPKSMFYDELFEGVITLGKHAHGILVQGSLLRNKKHLLTMHGVVTQYNNQYGNTCYSVHNWKQIHEKYV